MVVIRLENTKKIKKELENYLINLNKKVLIISDNKLTFGTNFIHRLVKVNSKFLYYFNNDIQYGAKFILKRILDILISLFVVLFISPLLLIISFLIFIKGSSPVVIKQSRIGFMVENSRCISLKNNVQQFTHSEIGPKRFKYKKGPLFKIDEDPRIIKGLSFLPKI